MTTDRVNPPAWGVTEDPSDLPRVLRKLEAAFAEGREYEMSALDVAVLVRWIRAQASPASTVRIFAGPARSAMNEKELEGIRARDAACVTHSDGTIHCGEGGDLVAEDRRALMAEIDRLRAAEYPAYLRADAERQFTSDDGSMRSRVHTTIEFTAAVLKDEKAFALIVSAQLREGLREGKNVLVLAPR